MLPRSRRGAQPRPARPSLRPENPPRNALTHPPSHPRRYLPPAATAAGVKHGGGLPFQYKLAMRAPAEARSGSWDNDRWVWQPGPNRNGTLPPPPPPPAAAAAPGQQQVITASVNSRPAAAATVLVPLRVTWMSQRDGTAVVEADGYLEPNREHLRHRYRQFADTLAAIEGTPGGLDAFSRGWETYGLNRVSAWGGAPGAAGVVYREWAPGARALSLLGDFNGWDHFAHAATVDAFGVWTVFVPDKPDGAPAIAHGSFIKASVQTGDDASAAARALRLPAWVRYAVYEASSNEYIGVYWNPPASAQHVWRHPRMRTVHADDYVTGAPGHERLSAYTGGHRTGGVAAAPSAAAPSPAPAPGAREPAPGGLRIYEAHVGMGGEEPRVHTYREFADDILPRIARGGYNCVQLMAIMEHAYYGSFGYHVTSFLAPTSRFGTPEDLKYLVDAAHELGLLVIMDLVHSHACKNVVDGLNRWDGTDHHYFHGGARGNHDLWDSRLFDYSKLEVQRFLLSSARLFIEEFRFDGYRFDGVTSMMYHHHGLSFGFTGDYNEYFGGATDTAAVAYLMLANHMLHTCDPPALTVAEDVSGMPTLGRPVWEGGVGFDFRLAMALPDLWIKLLKETPDEGWELTQIAHTLVNRRWQERTIAYAESHDQALVGDKTLAFWLMDKEMYWHMSAGEVPVHPAVDRGVALHKMIRLLTYSLGGEAWLNFMGNEFGHPEWVDFPRAGNDWSYQHCRRCVRARLRVRGGCARSSPPRAVFPGMLALSGLAQPAPRCFPPSPPPPPTPRCACRQWHLVDDPTLRYKHMGDWDAAMHRLEDAFPWLRSRDNFVSLKNEGDKMLVVDRGTSAGPLVFVFNFHTSNSYTGYRVGVPCAGE